MPLSIAQGSGINPSCAAVGVGEKKSPLVWQNIDFDTHPAKAPKTPGYLVLLEGTELPSGNFYVRESGYYRFKGQAYYNHNTSGAEASTYLGLLAIGADGKEQAIIASANVCGRPGMHACVALDRIVKVTVPAPDDPGRYFQFATYILVGKGLHTLADGSNYCWGSIERLGFL